jgi:DNA-binding NtrC family response regulator
MSAPANLPDVAVLDDDLDFLHCVEDVLRANNSCSVRVFSHPDDLFTNLLRAPPQIVLLDMKMSPFRGEQALDRLQSAYPGICVIVVTGYPSLENMRATFQREVFDYLSKPFSLAQLRQTLATAVAAHGLGRAPREIRRERLGPESRSCASSDAGLARNSPPLRASASRRSVPSSALDARPSEVLSSIGF